uniref:Uncharacterized protein n=1 Tax=Fagus sylvatica TaxID=28930 RepID=A0A2N9FDC3_FAGSY
MVESMNGGGFLSLTDDDAYKFLDKLSESSQQWDFSHCRDKSSSVPKKGGLYEVEEADLRLKLDSLTRKVEALFVSRSVNSANLPPNEGCSLCTNPLHMTQNCPSLSTLTQSSMEQVNAFNDFRKQIGGAQPMHSHNQFPPGFRPPMQSYLTPSHIPQSTPQFVAPQQQQTSLEDSLKAFMQLTGQSIVDIKNSTHLNTQAIVKLENQMGQLAKQMTKKEKGKFPSQPIPNPKGQFVIGNSSSSTQEQEHVQSVVTLRSGRLVNNQVSMSVEDDLVRSEKEERTLSLELLLPARLATPKKGAQFGDILEVFKQVHINIPFLDAIQQVTFYAKFLKDLVTIKRKTHVSKKAFLTEQVSSILQCRVPIKYKDLGCPTIYCTIGDNLIERALLDLGASVNLLPYSVYVDKFYFPVDFIVLDTQPTQNASKQIPVILGHPFSATSNALINCRTSVMKISFGNMTVELSVFDISKQPPDEEDASTVCMIDSLVHETFIQSTIEDPLEACLAHFVCNFDIDESIEQVNALLDSALVMSTDRWQPKAISLTLSSSPSFPSVVEPPKLDLKPLPDTLKYNFLGPSESLPVIITSDLDDAQEQKLFDVLKEHKEVIRVVY